MIALLALDDAPDGATTTVVPVAELPELVALDGLPDVAPAEPDADEPEPDGATIMVVPAGAAEEEEEDTFPEVALAVGADDELALLDKPAAATELDPAEGTIITVVPPAVVEGVVALAGADDAAAELVDALEVPDTAEARLEAMLEAAEEAVLGTMMMVVPTAFVKVNVCGGAVDVALMALPLALAAPVPLAELVDAPDGVNPRLLNAADPTEAAALAAGTENILQLLNLMPVEIQRSASTMICLVSSPSCGDVL